MSEADLNTLVEEWVQDYKEFKYRDKSIIIPCTCKNNIRIVNVGDESVTLYKAMCPCPACSRHEIVAANPQFFELLLESIRSRIEHKSIIISREVGEGDDIQHAFAHFESGLITLKSGVYTNLTLDMKDCQLELTGDTVFNSCVIDNLKGPMTMRDDGISQVSLTNCYIKGNGSPLISLEGPAAILDNIIKDAPVDASNPNSIVAGNLFES